MLYEEEINNLNLWRYVMDFYILCYENTKKVGMFIRESIVKAASFCRDFTSANNFVIHQDGENSYLKGSRKSNDHIDWVRCYPQK